MRKIKYSDFKKLSITQLLNLNPFNFHSSSYPPPTSYRFFKNMVTFEEIWQYENTSHLFLNLYFPYSQNDRIYHNYFCINEKKVEIPDSYITALEKQAKFIVDFFQSKKKPIHFDCVGINGGNPSLLKVEQLNEVINILENIFQIRLNLSDLNIDVFPNCSEKFLEVLLERDVHRVNVEVQSFLKKDLKRLQNSLTCEQVQENLNLITSMSFPELSIDLFYKIDNQSEDDFLFSIEHAISYDPTECLISPLYPQDTFEVESSQNKNQIKRSNLYSKGRERLLEAGYHQDSMRRFVKKRTMRVDTSVISQKYSFNFDGSIGLGCGSHSITKHIHYSEPYSNAQPEIIRIIQDYMDKSPSDFLYIPYGIQLSEEDRRRRFIIQSLLKVKGLDTGFYRSQFHEEPVIDFPELLELLDTNLAHKNGSFIVLTDTGLEFSDTIGLWLNSQYVLDLIEN